jgi:glycosyltransferase involved in cell wall biosynthesis
MNILIYFPYNQRTVELQSMMEKLVHLGNKVVLLTSTKKGYLHDYVQRFGVVTETAGEAQSKLNFYTSNLKRLSSVIKKHEIEIVIAHQQKPALVAGLLRIFRPFKLIYVRHNSDEDYQIFPRKAKWLNKIVNALTPVKLAPSSIVQKFWIEHEGVPAKQIYRINSGYNFQYYEKPIPEEVAKIRDAYAAKLLVLSMARFVPAKRHPEMFSIISRLVKEGVDLKMMCLSGGPMEEQLKSLVDELEMRERIFLVGIKENIFDYIEACDVFMHLSTSEASNNAVKEVGLRKKPVIVCKGVGDFEDYIIDGKNGFLVDKDDPVPETYLILKNIAADKIDRAEIGEQLFKTITDRFDIEKVTDDYSCLLNYVIEN